MNVPSARRALPDFAIVGAPKCGTTALYTWLAGHERIAMSREKEPCFWSVDVGTLARTESLSDYADLWHGAPEDALLGEASTAYLESHAAIPAILAARPDARLIAMARNPVEMVYSRHSDLLHRDQEDVGDFEAAWRLQQARRRGERMPPECGEPHAIQYSRIGRIGDMIERFIAAVPEEQRLIILYDDLKADPVATYLRTLAFLGLEDDGRRDLRPANSNRNLRSVRLRRLHRSMPRLLGPIYAPARAFAQRVGLSPSALVNRLNVRPGPRRPLRPEFEAELIDTFRPQVEKLAALLGRDLSHWTRPGAG